MLRSFIKSNQFAIIFILVFTFLLSLIPIICVPILISKEKNNISTDIITFFSFTLTWMSFAMAFYFYHLNKKSQEKNRNIAEKDLKRELDNSNQQLQLNDNNEEELRNISNEIYIQYSLPIKESNDTQDKRISELESKLKQNN
ncbi:MAG: hypothetical protein GQ557_00805 [Mycoplasmataceae bacterium]|nr:hypothetical protein [Mycoplasmataceae bacterium]